MIKILSKLIWFFSRAASTLLHRLFTMPLRKSLLGKCGKKVYIGRKCSFNWSNVFIGNNVSINSGGLFICSRAKIYVGDNTMFGPNVTVITGGHRYDIVGKYMKDISFELKSPDDDKDIVFLGDNWIGANSIILKGVIVGEGSIIGAGSVVTKSIPPYQIWGGNPARYLKDRFSKENLTVHISSIKEKKNDFIRDDN